MSDNEVIKQEIKRVKKTRTNFIIGPIMIIFMAIMMYMGGLKLLGVIFVLLAILIYAMRTKEFKNIELKFQDTMENGTKSDEKELIQELLFCNVYSRLIGLNTGCVIIVCAAIFLFYIGLKLLALLSLLLMIIPYIIGKQVLKKRELFYKEQLNKLEKQ